MGYSKSSSKRETYSNTILSQEMKRSQVNNLTLYVGQLEKEKQTKPRVSRSQGSSSKTENNTAYVCDRYVSQVKNAHGGNHGQVVYDVWYQGDKLQRIQSSYVAPDGKESILDAAYITSLQNATPDALQLENVRVYEAEIGTVQEVYGETTYMGGLKDLVDGKGGKK